MFACAQPVAGLQESFVQPLPSLQFNAAPPQAPPEQVSLVVHAFPSLQGLELLAWVHPLAELHPSSVQAFPSLQFGGGPPTHAPAAHVSPVVHAFPSLHAALLLPKTQPSPGLHVSVVHTLPSLQVGAGPPTHAPPEQASFVVQALLSLQAATLFTCTQPDRGLQESSVQTLLSLQLGAGPPTQLPPEQVSFVVHALLSLHEMVLFVCAQTPDEQASVVHPLPSSHWLAWVHSMQPPIGVPAHVPPAQTSSLVQV